MYHLSEIDEVAVLDATSFRSPAAQCRSSPILTHVAVAISIIHVRVCQVLGTGIASTDMLSESRASSRAAGIEVTG